MFTTYFTLHEEEVHNLLFKEKLPALLKLAFTSAEIKGDMILVTKEWRGYKIVIPDARVEHNRHLLAKFLVKNSIFEFYVFEWNGKKVKKLTVLDLA